MWLERIVVQTTSRCLVALYVSMESNGVDGAEKRRELEVEKRVF